MRVAGYAITPIRRSLRGRALFWLADHGWIRCDYGQDMLLRNLTLRPGRELARRRMDVIHEEGNEWHQARLRGRWSSKGVCYSTPTLFGYR